uniref:Cytochrome b n=1 Tax=Aegista diversifamilia TaxID=1545397 RepID=A0A0U2DTQ6_AEGDI|nr:cytochrome b [Aegista diversifamilia]AKP55336.1 cytochrome b [Aegista diversifamilia]
MKKIREVESLVNLPSPSNISIWWNIGSMLGVMLVLQIVTGILLSFHYTADMYNTFNSIIHIMRDVPGGWFFRALHANGASMFFFLLYLHMARGIYFQSFITNYRTWMIGVTIYLMAMATAFLGYVLPWGQMSYWGATVITNLFSAIPYFGTTLVSWIWGGFSVDQATLNRFFSLHFLIPFALSVFVLLHLVFLHEKGSSNPLGNMFHLSKIPFHPYFTWKDFVGFSMMGLVLMLVVCFYPNGLTDPENFMEANPLVTPTHIQPEWYFLFAYAILRSIPSKLGGVIALVMAILVFYIFPVVFPLLTKNIRYPVAFSPLSQILFWIYIVVFFLLTWLGACPVEAPFIKLAQPLTLLYFVLPMLYLSSIHFWSRAINYFI